MNKTIVKGWIKNIARTVFQLNYSFLMLPVKLKKGRILFDDKELALVHQALLSQNLFSIGGKMIPAFEKEFASVYDVPYAVASTSGTAAIHTALGALDLNPGDEVITAPITDLGTIVPILYQNAVPVFADINDSYTMDPDDIERKISSRTKAIIVVHLFGNTCDMDKIMEISRCYDIPVIEDCAQAHMTKYKGKYVGTIGDIGCFSFQQSKHMTTGDGGMTITSNKAYYERMKFFVDKGYARKGWGARAYLFLAPNYRPTELTGAVGLAQLKKVEDVVRKRHNLGTYMTRLLSSIQGITPAPVTEGAEHSYWLYPIKLDASVDINQFAKMMQEKNIWVSAGYTGKPIYLCTESLTRKKTYGTSGCPLTCPGADKLYEYKEGLCPNAEKALKHLICIPMIESWTKQDVERTCEAVAECMNKLLGQGETVKITADDDKKHPELTPETPTVISQMKKEKVRIGIVGCGQMGKWHFDAYQAHPSVELAAFADKDITSAKRFASGNGAKTYSSHEEMISKEQLDGVSICSVPASHKKLVIDFLNTGIHVLCEKPLAVSLIEAEEMLSKAKEKRKILLTAFKFRFFDEVEKAKELIDKQGLGKIINFRLMFGGHLDMEGKWYADKEFSGGGVIMDNAPHAVDLIRYLLGEIRDVSAHRSGFQKIAVEDTAKLTFVMTNGATGTADLSWSSAVPSPFYLEIYGEDGAALLDHNGISYKYKTWDNWKRISNQKNIREAFNRQINHFIDGIEGKTPSVTTAEDGLKSQRVIDAIYASLK